MAVLLVAAPPASAQDAAPPASTFRAVLDRADLEPASIGGYRLRVYLSALALDGSVLAADVLGLTEPRTVKLTAARSEVRAPYALGRFAQAKTDLAIILVIQATGEYGDVLRSITEGADAGLLDGIPERTQLAIITYGEAVSTAKLSSLKTARAKLRSVSIEGAVAEPALLDAMDRAVAVAKRAKTEPPGQPLRKMIVLVSDGRDRANDRDRVTALGKRAGAAGIRIHTFGHAPNDQRRPLLLLGELSKRSFGTFRWLRKDATTTASWQQRFQQLRDEINQQYVLTYFVDDDPSGRDLRLSISGRTQLTALNELRVPAAGCNGEACEQAGMYCADACTAVRQGESRGVVGWIFLVIGIGIAAVIALGVIGYVLTKRQQARVPMPPVPGQVPMPMPRPMQTPMPPQPQPQPQVPATGARLYIMSGPRAGETLGVRHGFRIGAAPHNDLIIADGFASGNHAQIGIDAQGHCWLADLGSTNGTFVNGVRISQKALDHGVTVKIGSTEIRFLAQ